MSVIRNFLDLNKQNPAKVCVVGDIMIDEYYDVKCSRISPEAPVPVLLMEKDCPTQTLPGGAGNVACQLDNFNCQTTLVGPFPYDGKGLSHQARKYSYWNVPVPAVPIKRRFFTGNHQHSRIDVEQKNYGLDTESLIKAQEGLYKIYKHLNSEVTILSDYNKGLFSAGLGKAPWLKGKFTIVDPKEGPASEWAGCTIFKPNAAEAVKMSGGLTQWHKQAEYFMRETDCRAVLITQGGDGVVGIVDNDYFEYRPRKSVAAASVIGAGDCFIALLAAAISNGFSIEDAAEIAFEAGAVYVQNKHNKPITSEELRSHDDCVVAKYVWPEDLAKRNYKLAMTNGCFDILHQGHLELLKFAKKQADKLVVAVNSDTSVARWKGPTRPVNTLEDRKYMLSNLDFVDYVVSFDEDDPCELIKKIRPDVLVKGAEYSQEQVVGGDLVDKVILCPMQEGKSTTSIIEKIIMAKS